jgi:Fe(3+) dicitrate transport protein
VENGTPLSPVVFPQDIPDSNLVRVGGGQSNYGNLRDFYTLGLDNSWDIYHHVAEYAATLSLGARVHWERFEDARVIGDAPDARSGSFFDTAGTILPTAGRQNYETIALSLYAAEEVSFGRLIVRPGVRLEVFEQERVDLLRGSRLVDHSEYIILPGVGANYELTQEVNLFGGIHRGYTPPSTSTLNFLFGGADDRGFDLRSEKSWNAELGARAATGLASAELAAFHMYIEDMVAPANGTYFKNLGALRSYGIESSGTLRGSRANPFLPDIHVAYTWLQSEVVEGVVSSSQNVGALDTINGNRLPYAPEHTLVLGLSRDFDFGLSLAGNAKSVSWVYTDYENLTQTENRGDVGPIDGYVVFDASASYTRGRYTVFANAKNLLDNVYVSSRMHSSPYVTAANAQGILIGPRRQVNVGVSSSF